MPKNKHRRARGRQDASGHQRDLQNMEIVGHCRKSARTGLEEALERTCQGQPTAGYEQEYRM
jgi:hypothetical protein